jgi:hypothetical protein
MVLLSTAERSSTRYDNPAVMGKLSAFTVDGGVSLAAYRSFARIAIVDD